MAIICTTPVLGYSDTLEAADYPYFGAGRGPTPQLGSTVHVVNDDAAVTTNQISNFVETGVGTGIYGWSDPAAG